MEKAGITLSVFYDGQYYTALFERYDHDGYTAARQVFAAQPTDAQILDFVLHEYFKLRFSPAAAHEKELKIAVNPKRRQRQAAQAVRNVGMSTKAQAALKAQHEAGKEALKSLKTTRKRQTEDQKFAQRQLKRKEKHKGH